VITFNCLQVLDDLYDGLFTGDARDLRIASLTFGVLRASVSRAQRNVFCSALESLNDVVVEGAACLERGDQQFRLHVQYMLHLRITVADDAEDRLKEYMLKHMNESEVGNVRLCVRVRQIGGSVTVDCQIGYVAKDAGQPLQVLYNKGMTQDVLRARGAAYHQVAGNDVFRKKTELKPYGFHGTLAKFEHNELFPLCARMNHFQVARFMLLSGRYLFHGGWAAPVGMRAPVRVAMRWRQLLLDLRIRKDVDIWDVVCVLSKNEYEPGTEAAVIMEERDPTFDTMSFTDARVRARAAMRRLRNAALDGDGMVGVEEEEDNDDGLDSVVVDDDINSEMRLSGEDQVVADDVDSSMQRASDGDLQQDSPH
jgi:hypothetical protein